MNKKLKLSLALMLMAAATQAQSIGPSTINSAGGYGTIAGHDFAYSIGEMAVITTNTAGSMTITHGLLQPNDVWPDAVVDVFGLEQIRIYPNPAHSQVTLETALDKNGDMQVDVFDAAGRYVRTWDFDITTQSQSHQLDLADMSAGTYFLRLHFSPTHGNPKTQNYTITKK